MEKAWELFKTITAKYPNLGKDWGKNGKCGQYLYGDIFNWLKDEYGYEKLSLKDMHILNLMLIGNYVVKNRLL